MKRLTKEREKEISTEKIIAGLRERFKVAQLSSHRFWAELYHSVDAPIKELFQEIEALRAENEKLQTFYDEHVGSALDNYDENQKLRERVAALRRALGKFESNNPTYGLDPIAREALAADDESAK